MTETGFDPARFKAGQRANWDAMSAGWLAWQDKFERGGSAVSEQLLGLGGVGPGKRVLDLGTGIGEPALRAAELVGDTGHVTGLDLSAGMIELARQRVAQRSASNIDFVVGDLESVDLPTGSVDVVLSRWGLMFAVDRMAAFRTIARILVPGGVLTAAVWGPANEAIMVSTGYRVLAQRLALPTPPPGEPSPYSMADRDQVLRELDAAGFTQVLVSRFRAPFWLSSDQEYVEFYRTCSPPALLELIRQRFGSADDPTTWAQVAASVAPYRTNDGRIDLPSYTWLIRAEKPLH